MQVVISTFPYTILYKALVGLLVTGVGALILLPFRKVKKEWISLKDSIASTKAELIQQRTNCLTTLQSQGAEQITLLSKTVDALENVRYELAEQTGFLRAASLPVRRSRAKKK
jgi:hypothetical protein